MRIAGTLFKMPRHRALRAVFNAQGLTPLLSCVSEAFALRLSIGFNEIPPTDCLVLNAPIESATGVRTALCGASRAFDAAPHADTVLFLLLANYQRIRLKVANFVTRLILPSEQGPC